MELGYAQKIHDLFRKKGRTLAIAESCTGGLIAHMLTEISGASIFLTASVVAYSAEAKKRMLGIPGSLIEKEGMISEETARAMAMGAREKAGADIGLGITGNIGPDPMEDKPIGIVYIAVATAKETTSRGFIYEGSRSEIKEKAAHAALEFLYEAFGIWA